ncbi:MAG: ABC transporter permease [Nocardiopsaceae bacterium]|jgi:simple sugar transport system permease protein|nr:ABC transporter permease [Nocardiopsaceae bacterium]
MTTVTASIGLRASESRRQLAAATYLLLGVIDILVFGLFSHDGDASFELSISGSGVQIPIVHVPAALVCYAVGVISIAAGIYRFAVEPGKIAKRVLIGVVLVCFLIALLCWADAGDLTAVNLVNLMQQSFAQSIPLVLGALCGCMCERSGVINIAIEGQLLMGAFTGAIVASGIGSLTLGLISGSLAGGLFGLLLAVFAITFLVDQIILGVVLNVLALGLTGFLYDRLMVPNANLNAGNTFNAIKIPVLGDIPIIGPIFFDSTIFLYITYVLIIVIQIGLFRTRWGLRVRAVGEHPTAADTVGIKVLWTRYRNVVLGGMVAGIGGAYLTIGSVGFFNKDISSGYGFIALAAMIFGRWTPLGSVAAALLFGFSAQLAVVLSSINVPLDSNILQMTPYVATIIAVAGLVGKVRAPAADGRPYVKA